MRQMAGMEYKGDKTYIEQVLAGNSNSYSHIVDRHKDKAFNLAFRICGNFEEAEEISQDSFLKAFRSLSSFKMKSSFSTWLYRIVYNTSISHVRTRKAKVLSLEDFPADLNDFAGHDTSHEEAEKEYRNALINFALQKITEEERALITLFYYDEMSPEEIGDVTGISKSNLKVKLFRTRRKMHGILEKAEMKNLIYNE
jgi:RNA polymerase sigma factor (sigma-70 family)